MNIVHVWSHYTLFSKGGGVERYIHQIVSRVAMAGHQATVLAKTADVAPPSTPYTIRPVGYGRLWHEIGRATVVHIHGPRTFFSAVAGIFTILRRRPLFYTAHCFYRGKTPLQTSQKWVWDRLVERFLFRYASTVFVLSDYWRDYLPTLGVHPRHCVVLPNGVDVDALVNEPTTAIQLDGDPAILSVSRLDPVKRIDDIITALRAPQLAGAHLHIVGLGADEQRLQALVATHDVAARVTFHHFKTDAEVAALARAADVFVIASAEEGMPTSILEMVARGVPVVASAIPGNLGIMDRLHYPSTYPLGDIAALASLIAASAHTPALATLRDGLRAIFDWKAIVATMLLLYHESHAARTR